MNTTIFGNITANATATMTPIAIEETIKWPQVLFAAAGLLAIVYLVLRQRDDDGDGDCDE